LLLAADGMANSRVAAELRVSPATVAAWRVRFACIDRSLAGETGSSADPGGTLRWRVGAVGGGDPQCPTGRSAYRAAPAAVMAAVAASKVADTKGGTARPR